MPGVCVVVGAQQIHLPAPAGCERRRLALELLPQRERAIHAAVGGERPFPVPFEREQAVRSPIGDGLAEEKPRVLAQDLPHVAVRGPGQARPDGLVHVVVDAVGIADEPVGVWRGPGVDGRIEDGTRIHGLAAEGEAERRIPPGHLILRPDRVGDVGIVAQRIAPRQPAPRHVERRTARTGDQPPEPRRVLAFDPCVDGVDPLRVEPLQREPDLRPRVRGGEPRRHVLEVRNHELRRVVAGIPAGEEDRVEPRQVAEERIHAIQLRRAACAVVRDRTPPASTASSPCRSARNSR